MMDQDNRTLEERKREEETEERLRRLSEETEIPESLEPEAIERMLQQQKKTRRKQRFMKYVPAAAAAACVCLVAAVGGLGKWNDTVAEKPDGNVAEGEKMTAGSTGREIAVAEDYDEIYSILKAASGKESKTAGMEQAMPESTADMNGSAGAGVDGGSSYSDTNVREEGVGEADIVKTDGSNLYIVNGNKVSIVGIETAEMQERSTIELEDECYISELYVEDGKLAVLYTNAEYRDGKAGIDGYFREYTCTDVYDVSDASVPKKTGTVTQSGYYNTMRAKDGYLYVLSSFYASSVARKDDVSAYVPMVGDRVLEASDIYMPQSKLGSQYTVISAFPLEDPENKTDSKAVFGSVGICYVSGENIYITEECYGEEDADVNRTAIRKLSYGDGRLDAVAQTKVDGRLNDSFSIDEYEGNLRLVTTVSSIGQYRDGIMPLVEDEEKEVQEETASDTNTLYILDDQLELVSQIAGLAEDEQVYSARFMGETGYFVTFRQIDPLFSVDLSDPANPRIIGELKIPGFSEYLHPYGNGNLLGIGMAVDEEGITTEGVKLSMFDISNPSDVKEENHVVLEDLYGTEAAYNYKSVFVDVDKNLFGFLAYGEHQYYYLFAYDEEGGFREVFSRDLGTYVSVRGLYAGDTFYLTADNTVISYRLDGFEKIDDIVL